MYEPLIGSLREDSALLATMWQEAESRLDEAPEGAPYVKMWWVTLAPNTSEPAAWAALVLGASGEVVCCNNYERGEWRGLGLYEQAYRRRHAILAALGMPAVTYIFAQPLALHLADGWRITGQGDSAEMGVPSHHWYELRWS